MLETAHQHTHESKSLYRPLSSPCQYSTVSKRGGRPFVRDGWYRVWGVQVKRLLYEEKYGPIPEGQGVLALCHRKWCVNPDHMTLVASGQEPRINRFRRWCAAVGQNPLAYVKAGVIALTAAVEKQVKAWGKYLSNRKQRHGEEPEKPKDAYEEQPPEEDIAALEADVRVRIPCAARGCNTDVRVRVDDFLPADAPFHMRRDAEQTIRAALQDEGEIPYCSDECRYCGERGLSVSMESLS